MKAEPILQVPNTILGEGPVWDYRNNQLYWVDIMNGLLHLYNPATHQNEAHAIGQYLGAAVPCDNGDFILAMRHGFAFYNPLTKQLQNITDPESHLPLNRFNDGKCDPAGRLWAGTMMIDEPRTTAGNLYRIGNDQVIYQMLSDIYISNGLAWNAAANKMFYIDTMRYKIVSFDFDVASGMIENQEDIILTHGESPDGMTIDENDNLWVAFWGEGKVVCFDSRNGKVVTQVEVPAECTTSCAFGGADLDTLYITSAAKEGDELGGTLFAAYVGVKGRRADFFKTA